jgi:hypothetical protein
VRRGQDLVDHAEQILTEHVDVTSPIVSRNQPTGLVGLRDARIVPATA